MSKRMKKIVTILSLVLIFAIAMTSFGDCLCKRC